MIIADENIDFNIIVALRSNDIDVYSIAEKNNGISDKQVIELARKQKKIILTEDKDFGEWVFAHNVKDVAIIFLRYNWNNTDDIIKILVKLLEEKKPDLLNKFTTVTMNKIRIRNLN